MPRKNINKMKSKKNKRKIHGGKTIKKNGGTIDCCRISEKSKSCTRKSDNKTFTFPRKFNKIQCLTKPIKGFTMRASCAPYKDCKRKTKKGGAARIPKKNKVKVKSPNRRQLNTPLIDVPEPEDPQIEDEDPRDLIVEFDAPMMPPPTNLNENNTNIGLNYFITGDGIIRRSIEDLANDLYGRSPDDISMTDVTNTNTPVPSHDNTPINSPNRNRRRTRRQNNSPPRRQRRRRSESPPLPQ